MEGFSEEVALALSTLWLLFLCLEASSSSVHDTPWGNLGPKACGFCPRKCVWAQDSAGLTDLKVSLCKRALSGVFGVFLHNLGQLQRPGGDGQSPEAHEVALVTEKHPGGLWRERRWGEGIYP